MSSKDTYRSACKEARKRLFDAYRAYRVEIKKQRLLRERVQIQAELKEMGVTVKQIPVVVMEGTPQRVKVYSETIAVSDRARSINVKKGRKHESKRLQAVHR